MEEKHGPSKGAVVFVEDFLEDLDSEDYYVRVDSLLKKRSYSFEKEDENEDEDEGSQPLEEFLLLKTHISMRVDLNNTRTLHKMIFPSSHIVMSTEDKSNTEEGRAAVAALLLHQVANPTSLTKSSYKVLFISVALCINKKKKTQCIDSMILSGSHLIFPYKEESFSKFKTELKKDITRYLEIYGEAEIRELHMEIYYAHPVQLEKNYNKNEKNF